MLRIRICEDIDECCRLWQQVWPQQGLFDLWPVRYSFHKHYRNRPYFVVAENCGKVTGLLALSWLEQAQHFGHFPGETWRGKTWLEQNRILARDGATSAAMLAAVPGRLHLRYLAKDSFPDKQFTAAVDETGYLFQPPAVNYSFSQYRELIPNKSRKKIDRELARFHEAGVSFRHDHRPDIALLFRLNLAAFGEASYFAEERFMHSFSELISFLSQAGLLRITTVLVGGKEAAVDLGAVLNGQYTVLAGGTSPDFPGIAKLINFHHLEWACHNRMQNVDFLCGDFGWKERFRLTPQPLFELRLNNNRAGLSAGSHFDHRSRTVAL